MTGGAQVPGNDARAAAAPRLAGSLAAKWTLAIALLLVLGMGLLGAYLIGQQERAFERYSSRLGELLADQLARSASEPLMADDAFQLELLVRRQLDQELVIGAAVLGHDGVQRASAGFVPVGAQRLAGNMQDGETVVRMSSSERAASTYVRPVTFQDVNAGHVLLTDAASNTYGMLGMLMINQVAGGTLDDITPGLEFVQSILPNATVVSKSPEIQQNFAQGNAWITPYAQDYAYTLIKAGLPVDFVLPEEGGVVAPITVNLVAGRENRIPELLEHSFGHTADQVLIVHNQHRALPSDRPPSPLLRPEFSLGSR